MSTNKNKGYVPIYCFSRQLRPGPSSRLWLTCLISLLLSACSMQRKTVSGPMDFPAFDAESHRGGRGVMPENTIPAMLYSLSLEGITTLEMDAHVTKDHKIVLYHDDHLNPKTTLKPNGEEIRPEQAEEFAIMQMNFRDLQKFDIGSKFYDLFPRQKKIASRIPLLEEVIDSVQHYINSRGRAQVFYNIETKSSEAGDGVFNPSPEEFVSLLMEVIERKNIKPFVIIQSADARTLRVLHEKYPEVRSAFLVGSRRKQFTVEEDLELLGFKPFIYSPNFKYLSADEVQLCHDMGIKVVAWTPNSREDIERLKSWGVDGIITDYPELLLD